MACTVELANGVFMLGRLDFETYAGGIISASRDLRPGQEPSATAGGQDFITLVM